MPIRAAPIISELASARPAFETEEEESDGLDGSDESFLKAFGQSLLATSIIIWK